MSPQTKLDRRRIKETITSGIGIGHGGPGSARNFLWSLSVEPDDHGFQIVVEVILTWYLADIPRSEPCQRVEDRECAEPDDGCCGYFCGVSGPRVVKRGEAVLA
jgi:hypothetical protein